MRKFCYAAGGILYWMLLVLLFGNLLLFTAGIRPFVVVSGSMEPAIRTGSISWVDTRASPDEMKTGEILAFTGNNTKWVFHRIAEKKEEGFVTKGDANEKCDAALVGKDKVKGKVLFSVPFLGYLLPKSGVPAVIIFFTGSVLLAGVFQSNQRENRIKIKTGKTGENKYEKNKKTDIDRNGNHVSDAYAGQRSRLFYRRGGSKKPSDHR